MIIPTAALSIMGLVVVGHIGQNIIVNMGGKTIGIFFAIVLDVAAAIIGLNFAWDGIQKVASVFHIML